MIIFVQIPNLFGLYFGHFIFGLSHQLMIMTIIYFLNKKFSNDVVRYTGYVFTGSAVCLLWGYIFSKTVNPFNENKTRKFVLDDNNVEYAFSLNVSKRFPYLCLIYGLSNFVVITIISFIISDIPISKKENENDSESMSMLSQKINESHLSANTKLTIEETVFISKNPSGK
jgi:hypothetical protein